MQIYLKLILEGNYAEAGGLLEQMQGNIVRSSGESESPSKLLPKLLPTAMTASATPWGVAIRLRELYRLQRNVIRNLQAGEGEFFFRRGILSLIEGDIAGARRRFEQTTVPAIKEWDLPEFQQPEAQRLLRLIRRAEKSGK
jgi:hypothetical protein